MWTRGGRASTVTPPRANQAPQTRSPRPTEPECAGSNVPDEGRDERRGGRGGAQVRQQVPAQELPLERLEVDAGEEAAGGDRGGRRPVVGWGARHGCGSGGRRLLGLGGWSVDESQNCMCTHAAGISPATNKDATAFGRGARGVTGVPTTTHAAT